MKQIFVHLDKCTGCKTCELACAIEHSKSKNLFAAIFESPRPLHRLYVEAALGKPIPILCRHCDDAPCLNACISGAIYHDPQREGVVMPRGDKCIGCWTCVMMCPYGVIGRQHNGRRVAIKCDRCPDRDTPACVASCPTKALEYQEVEVFAQERREGFAASVAAAGR